jgi:DNA-binding CsgD family transcriptional regulator
VSDLALIAYYLFSYSAPFACLAICVLHRYRHRDKASLYCLAVLAAALVLRVCLNFEYFFTRFMLGRTFFYDYLPARLALFGSQAALIFFLPAAAWALAGRPRPAWLKWTTLALSAATLAGIVLPFAAPHVYARIRLILRAQQAVAGIVAAVHALCALGLAYFARKEGPGPQRGILAVQAGFLGLSVPVQALETLSSLNGLLWPRPLSFDYFLFFAWAAVSIAQYAKRFMGERPKAAMEVPEAFISDFGISGRERDIVVLLAQGLSNKEIGSRLSISEKTVKNHVYSVYRKVGVQARVNLLRKLMEY